MVMKTIDHRVIIPAPAAIVWEFISDIRRNPDWQADCAEVVFLTSLRQGPGLRWRYTTPKRREYVVEVSAWYNGLGYEYFYVDGPGFKEARGRIRVQETPDGTVVQWTFSYQFRGLFGGSSSQIDDAIAESLLALYDHFKQERRGGFDEREAKSLIREAPDVEARAIYKPRHPSTLDPNTVRPAEHQITRPPSPFELGVQAPNQRPSEAPRPAITIPEPPVKDSDTRPNRFAPPTAQPAAPMQEVAPSAVPDDVMGEPDFLHAIDDLLRFEPPHDPLEDTQPRPAASAPSAPAPSVEPPVERAAIPEPYRPWTTRTITTEVPEAEADFPTRAETPIETAAAVASAIDDEADAIIAAAELEPVSAEAEADVIETFAHEPAPAPDDTPVRPALVPASADDLPAFDQVQSEPEIDETDSRSIWEIFNVQRPPLDAQSADPAPAEAVAALESITPESTSALEPAPLTPTSIAASQAAFSITTVQPIPTRTGLRLLLRRHAVRVRRP